MEALNLKFLDLQSWGEDTRLTLVEVENLQHNLDAHGLIFKSFKNLLEIAEGELSKVLTKSAKAYDTLDKLHHKGGYLEATKIYTLRLGPVYEKWELTSNNHNITFAIHFFG